VDEIEDSFGISIKIPSDLSSRLRSHLLDDVEHLLQLEAVLAEDRVREIVEVGLAGVAPVLLSVFVGRSSLDDSVTLTVDTRYRLADSQVFGMCINNWRPAVYYAIIRDENIRGGYLVWSLETLSIYSKSFRVKIDRLRTDISHEAAFRGGGTPTLSVCPCGRY
jgi:hypothetical protein